MTVKSILAAFGSVAALGLILTVSPVAAEDTAAPAAAAEKSDNGQAEGPLNFTLKNIEGQEQKLSDYRGKVVLLVNVASKCGYTPQYEGLQKVYEKYKDQGLVVIGIPANNFGAQEPGTNEEIKQFCSTKYNVTFPLMAKVSVKGDDIDPLYKWLTDPATNKDFGGEIGWNFTKFLIGRDGKVVGRYESKVKPDDAEMTGAIETALAAEKK